MEQVVRVQKCEPDGTAQVLHIRQSACSGDCHQCAGCGAAQEKILLTVRNPIGAQPGDMVVIRSDSGPVLAAAAILYLLPLALFFVGYGVFAALGGNDALGGCLAFVFGLVGAKLYDSLVVKKKKTMYTIIGYKRG